MPETARISQFAPQSLRIEEFCSAFGISRRTFSRMRAAGDGPAVTWLFGTQVILKSSADEWVKARTERRGRPYEVLSYAS